jgi:predicted RNA-binding protein associated with RNAse of E/G family
VDVQAATLEALVRAVEQDVIPYKRLEDALKRGRVTKERFLAAQVAINQQATLRRVLGCDEHQRIVDEMSRFV